MHHSIVDCSKTQILLETLRTRSQHRVDFFCIFGSRTFVPISSMCKKQTSVPHSSTETEIISLDAGLRMDEFIWSRFYGMWWLKCYVHRTTPYLEKDMRQENDRAIHQVKPKGHRRSIVFTVESCSCERTFISWWISVENCWGRWSSN